jgi:hypothetical protein
MSSGTKGMQIAARIVAGHERELALELRGAATEDQWKLLAALAAEVLQLHEAAAAGSAVVVVSGAAQAERVLRDLRRDQPTLAPRELSE